MAKIGDIIKIIKMDDSDGKDKQAHEYCNRIGRITRIDDLGQLHGTWGGLAVVPGLDEFEIL